MASAYLRETDTLCETRIHMVKGVQHQPFCRLLVRKVQGRRVNEGETQRLGTVVSVHLNVDGRRADVGRVAATALNELGDGSELFLGDVGGDVAGIEEEAEEGGLAGAATGDHEGVGGWGVGWHCRGSRRGRGGVVVVVCCDLGRAGVAVEGGFGWVS